MTSYQQITMIIAFVLILPLSLSITVIQNIMALDDKLGGELMEQLDIARNKTEIEQQRMIEYYESHECTQNVILEIWVCPPGTPDYNSTIE